MKVKAIAASDLASGTTLIGDSICPTRYGTGCRVDTVTTEGRITMALTSAGEVELLNTETVYVTA